MIERHLHTLEDVEELILWMQSPPNKKPIVSFDANKYLERLQLADLWLRTHMSTSKVWQMLLTHYLKLGVKYSESTARRDVADAQKLYASLTSHTVKYWTDIMIDKLMENIISARLAGKQEAVARTGKVLLDYLLLAERLGIQDATQTIEVARMVKAAPEELGVAFDPDIEQKLADFKARRAKMRLGSSTDAVDTDFTEIGNGTGEDH